MIDRSPEFGIYSKRIFTDAGIIDGTILIADGVILSIENGKVDDVKFPIEDVGNLVVMPGIIDSHVHINEPGRTEWEGFETITKAAIAGGITTLVDMPLNASPVTTTPEALLKKIEATKGKLYCHCGFWGGLIPDNINTLDALCDAGVLGIKVFLTHSGIDDFPNVTEPQLREGLKILKQYQLPLLAHAELDTIHDGMAALDLEPTNYNRYLASRPRFWEDSAIEMLIELCDEFKTPVHIVHLSSADSIPAIAKAKAKGLPLTVETCPQYLYFHSEEIPNGNTLFKCAPPIREKENQMRLWEALKNGTIDFVVTDHSPSTPELKEIESGNFKKAWGGISSIQFALPIVWTAAKERGFHLEEILNWMSSSVAEFIHFENSKGKIRAGYDADFVVWNPEESFAVKKEDIHFRHAITPYEGEVLFGVVKETYVMGRKVFDNGQFPSSPTGKILLRNQIR